MPWPVEKQRPRGRFGALFQAHMARARITPTGLSHRLELGGHRLHPSAISHYMSEDRTIAPELVNRFAKALDLDEDQTTVLHQAAALDYGYEIGEDDAT